MGRVGNIPSGAGSGSGSPQQPSNVRGVDRSAQRVVIAAIPPTSAAAAAAAPPPALAGRARVDQASGPGSRARAIVTDDLRKEGLETLNNRIATEYTQPKPNLQRAWNAVSEELRADPRFCEWAIDLGGALHRFFPDSVFEDVSLQRRCMTVDPQFLIEKQPGNLDLMAEIALDNPGLTGRLPANFWSSEQHVKDLLERLPTIHIGMVPFKNLDQAMMGRLVAHPFTPLRSEAILNAVIQTPEISPALLLWAPQSTQEVIFRDMTPDGQARLKRHVKRYDADFQETLRQMAHPEIQRFFRA